ncbi:ABC transporter ATP-binding protein [uncultured Endozoicomonas sp.]|uniref:ABC transporter ATP-binding protein n=1 Tax=uncultured Endozoicomonas sp. TaxID=432652 RepID=UPI00261D82DF|nr:ABC transporter ATP-binding protein [uncultured Endozoicomonas sp.]
MNNLTLSLDQVCYQVGKKLIVKTVSTEIRPGKITAILGPNGSGKSTLLKLISGLISPSKGAVLLGNKALHAWARKALARELTLLPQHSTVPLGMTVENLVACGRYPHAGPFGRMKAEDHQAVSSAIRRVDMKNYASELVDHLSGGEMQRVWLAMVLAQETGILLLDEPTSWLDIAHQLRLLEIVRQLNQEKKTTVVWILHDLNQALQYSDDIVLMNSGQIVRHGEAHQVLDSQIISDVFGVTTTQFTPEGHKDPLFLPVGEAPATPTLQSVKSREVA